MVYLFVLNVGKAGLRRMHVNYIAKIVKLCALIVDKNSIAQKIYANQWCDDDASTFVDYAAACFPTFCHRYYFLLVGMFYYHYQIAPYVFKLQEKDPMNEPLW